MLLGSNLPHWFKEDDSFYDTKFKHEVKPAEIVIQFSLESFGLGFFDIDEMKSIKSLLMISETGLQLKDSTRNKINNILNNNINYSPQDRFIALLTILDIISKSHEVQTLSDIWIVGGSKRTPTAWDIF
jgi:hypothetical protein